MASELGRLFFGRDDAELDIAEGGLLQAGFLRTGGYEAARTARKHLIIGRKGSGKSAICRTLAAEDDPAQATVLVTPDALSAAEIRTFELQGIPPAMAKGLIWRYVLAVQVAKYLVAHAERAHKKSSPSSIAGLRKFLVANGELDEQLPKFWQIVQKLKGSVSLEAFGVKAGVEVTGPSEGIRTANQLDVIERRVGEAIEGLGCPDDHARLLILVDQIEDVWSDDIESERLVIGLLRAARDVSATFRRVECVVFLRSDIYELLQFADKDKFHGEELHVDWTADRLLELAVLRARASLGRPIDETDLWHGLFPAAVDHRDIRDLLISHTLRRPRDMIHLCNACRDTAEQNGHPTIQPTDVTEAIARYSKWKLTDLPNEYLINYPYLGGLVALFQDSGYVVGRRAFEMGLKAALEALRGRFPDRAYALTPDAVLDVLYHVGFLGVHRNGRVVYAPEQENRVEPTDETLYIHPAFRHALRAHTPTRFDLTVAQIGTNVEYAVRNQSPQVSGYSPVQRSDVAFELAVSIDGRIDQLLAGVRRLKLPKEVRDEIFEALLRIQDTFSKPREHSTDRVSPLRNAHLVAEALLKLRQQLTDNGLTGNKSVRTFARQLSEDADMLRQEARGSLGRG
jgi:hypothetical protein